MNNKQKQIRNFEAVTELRKELDNIHYYLFDKNSQTHSVNKNFDAQRVGAVDRVAKKYKITFEFLRKVTDLDPLCREQNRDESSTKEFAR
jgi:hypothetical protein